jgi:hypothetical protein
MLLALACGLCLARRLCNSFVGKKFVLLLRNCIVRKGAKHIQFELADREKKAKLVMVS